MDSETKLCGSIDDIKQLTLDLAHAYKEAKKTGEVQHVRTILEQTSSNGPWRLVLTVCPE
jgi:hypothetical protein